MQPTWAVLAVAFLGVAGTLGAAIFTQVWGARREDRRWRQEQAAEDQRWQRARQERREQWQHEDQLRAGQQRREAYAQFLLAVTKWTSVAYTLAAEHAETLTAFSAEELARLSALIEQAEAACPPLRLYGSVEASDASDEVCRVMISFVRALAEGPMNSDLVAQAVLAFRRTSDAALHHARVDLGLGAPAELGPS
jgi:hypothetical protein